MGVLLCCSLEPPRGGSQSPCKHSPAAVALSSQANRLTSALVTFSVLRPSSPVSCRLVSPRGTMAGAHRRDRVFRGAAPCCRGLLGVFFAIRAAAGSDGKYDHFRFRVFFFDDFSGHVSLLFFSTWLAVPTRIRMH